jgi:predicted NAD/FAD-binding protein
VEVLTRDGVRNAHDVVVFGCHADEVLALLDSPHPQEREVLGRFRYQTNRAVLHQDIRLMPRRRLVWSSWNYMTGGQAHASSTVSVTYWMNRLQRLKSTEPYLVTLNPVCEPARDKVIEEMHYDHPIYDHAAISAQAHIPSLQGQDRLWFCGSYTGYGFHEDALRSAVYAAARLGVPPPWEGPASMVAAPICAPTRGQLAVP